MRRGGIENGGAFHQPRRQRAHRRARRPLLGTFSTATVRLGSQRWRARRPRHRCQACQPAVRAAVAVSAVARVSQCGGVGGRCPTSIGSPELLARRRVARPVTAEGVSDSGPWTPWPGLEARLLALPCQQLQAWIPHGRHCRMLHRTGHRGRATRSGKLPATGAAGGPCSLPRRGGVCPWLQQVLIQGEPSEGWNLLKKSEPTAGGYVPANGPRPVRAGRRARSQWGRVWSR